MCTDVTQGGLPGYVGAIDHQEVQLGSVTILLETWPQYRIGSSVWPSGWLLAHALLEGVAELPQVKGRHVAELGAGPGIPGLVCGMLGAASVTVTDRIELVPLITKNIEVNGLTANCRAQALDWPFACDSSLACINRGDAGPLDIVLAADVVYYEEQDPLMDALVALLAPQHTVLVLAYRQRTSADREYLEQRILPRLAYQKLEHSNPQHGSCEIYVGTMR